MLYPLSYEGVGARVSGVRRVSVRMSVRLSVSVGEEQPAAARILTGWLNRIVARVRKRTARLAGRLNMIPIACTMQRPPPLWGEHAMRTDDVTSASATTDPLDLAAGSVWDGGSRRALRSLRSCRRWRRAAAAAPATTSTRPRRASARSSTGRCRRSAPRQGRHDHAGPAHRPDADLHLPDRPRREHLDRHDLVLITSLFMPLYGGPTGAGRRSTTASAQPTRRSSRTATRP